jgi:hypothetical protein
MGFDLVISKAREMSAEIDKLTADSGGKAQGFWGNVATGWKEMAGLNAPVATGPATAEELDAVRNRARTAQAASTLQGFKPQSLDQRFTEWFQKETIKPSVDQAKAKYEELAKQIEEERKATAEAATAKDRARKVLDDAARQIRDEELLGIKDSATQRAGNEMSGAFFEGDYNRVFELQKQAADAARDEQLRKQAADKAKADADRAAQEEQKRFEPARNAWRSEAGNPAGNAGTTLANSVDAIRAINDAQMAGVRQEATQRQLAETIKQTQVLERIETALNTPSIVGAI